MEEYNYYKAIINEIIKAIEHIDNVEGALYDTKYKRSCKVLYKMRLSLNSLIETIDPNNK